MAEAAGSLSPPGGLESCVPNPQVTPDVSVSLSTE